MSPQSHLLVRLWIGPKIDRSTLGHLRIIDLFDNYSGSAKHYISCELKLKTFVVS